MTDLQLSRRWYGLLYCAGVLLVVIPSLGFLQAYPVHLDSPTWRASAVGLLGSTVLFPLLGLLAATVAARLLGHRWVLLGLSVVLALVALGLLVSLPFFVLDTLELRHNLMTLRANGVLKERALLGFEMNVGRAALQCGLAALVAAFGAWVGWVDGRAVLGRSRRHAARTTAAANMVAAVRQRPRESGGENLNAGPAPERA